MINFDEEIKKFKPSIEISEVEDAIYDHELQDITDIMQEMMKNKKDQYSE